QFFAFFNRDVEVDLPVPRPGEEPEYQRKKAEHDRKKAELQAAVEAYRKDHLLANQKRWEEGLKLPELRQVPGQVSSVLLTEPAKRTDTQRRVLSDYYAKID